MKIEYLGDRAGTRENNFDFLRFFAALQVILYHTFALSGQPPRFPGFILFQGALGVDIFFVISGFLIMKSRMEDPSLLSYLKKRFLRIAPGLTVAIIFCIFIIGPLTSSLPAGEYLSGLASLPRHLPRVFERNHVPGMVNGSLWTLKVEAAAYLLVAMFGLTKISKARLLFIVFFIGLLLLNSIEAGSPEYSEVKVWNIYLHSSIRCLLLFLAGSLFYLYRKKAPLSIYLFLPLLMITLAASSAGYESIIILTLPYLVLYFAYSRVPFNKFGRYGDFSYGLYILAFPVQQTLLYFWSAELNNFSFFLLAFAFAFLLAALSWYFVEKPALRLKAVSFFNGKLNTKRISG